MPETHRFALTARFRLSWFRMPWLDGLVKQINCPVFRVELEGGAPKVSRVDESWSFVTREFPSRSSYPAYLAGHR